MNVEANLSVEHSYRDALLKFITIKLAPVLVKVKPAVLVGICSNKNGCDCKSLWESQKNVVMSMLNVSYVELKKSRQILFYDPELLMQTVTAAGRKEFLKEFGYSDCITLDDYLMLLSERFNSNNFPHEIGIFLGYPLKDVKGFLRFPAVTPVQSGLWKVFGDAEPSIRIMRTCKKSEEYFKRIMAKKRNPLMFLDHLKRKFLLETQEIFFVA